jgi:hypothetical protein
LTAEQKREVIAALLREDPTRSNRATASLAKVDDKTVGSVRRDLEGRAEIPHVDKVVDTKGRRQPTSKTMSPEPAKTDAGLAIPAGPMAAPLPPAPTVSVGRLAGQTPSVPQAQDDDPVGTILSQVGECLHILNRMDAWPCKSWSSKAAEKRCVKAIGELRSTLWTLNNERLTQLEKLEKRAQAKVKVEQPVASKVSDARVKEVEKELNLRLRSSGLFR